jgi:hypothetical protein
MSDKAVYGYLAGIIDGEGHITITRSITEGRKVDGSDCVKYICTVGARNTDKRLMAWLKQHFGGEIYPNKSKNPKWKTSYNWQLFGNKNLELLLLAILPYLQIEREQANIALEFLRLEGQRVPTKRQELCERIHRLNKRGVTVETNTFETQKYQPETLPKVGEDFVGAF